MIPPNDKDLDRLEKRTRKALDNVRSITDGCTIYTICQSLSDAAFRLDVTLDNIEHERNRRMWSRAQQAEQQVHP